MEKLGTMLPEQLDNQRGFSLLSGLVQPRRDRELGGLGKKRLDIGVFWLSFGGFFGFPLESLGYH